MTDRLPLLLLVIAITVVSGFADAQGFLHAAKIWENNTFSPGSLLRSALGFAVGISLYYVGLRYQLQLGLRAPEAQTLLWFGVTLLGVAVFSGEFWRWKTLDQLVGLMVLAGIAWLMARTGK